MKHQKSTRTYYNMVYRRMFQSRYLRTLLCALLCTLATATWAQSLPATLAQFRDICLRERRAVETSNLDSLDRCAADFRKLSIKQLRDRIFVPQQTEQTDFSGHLQFSAMFVDSLVVNGLDLSRITRNLHVVHKGQGDLLITHKIIPAGGACAYAFNGSGEQSFLVVCEAVADICLQIDHPATATSYKSGPTDDGTQAFVWQMGKTASPCTLTITNHEARPLCCAIVSL